MSSSCAKQPGDWPGHWLPAAVLGAGGLPRAGRFVSGALLSTETGSGLSVSRRDPAERLSRTLTGTCCPGGVSRSGRFVSLGVGAILSADTGFGLSI